MKYLLIAIATVIAVFLFVVLFIVLKFSRAIHKAKAGGTFHKAHGHALFSAIGAWTRVQEYARAQGKADYIVEADKKMAHLEKDLSAWRQSMETADLDMAAFEQMRATAYETTDRNIKNGQNPLAYLDSASNS
jgi:hypothetical protein